MSAAILPLPLEIRLLALLTKENLSSTLVHPPKNFVGGAGLIFLPTAYSLVPTA